MNEQTQQRTVEQLCEGLRSFGVHARQHVLVGGHREAGCRVSEPFADDFDGYARYEEQRCVRVAEIMQSDAR